MAKFAFVRDGVVAEVFALNPEWPEDLDVRSAPNSVQPGWTVDDGGAFHAPLPPGPNQVTRFSFLEFMDLFTEAEQLAVAGAAMTNVSTKLWYDRAVGAQFIDLTDARLGAGLDALVAAELVTASRRDEVLQGTPPT